MTTDSIRRDIEKQARKAIFQRALFRVENAIIIAGALLLAVFLPAPFPLALPWFGAWTWLALGAVGVAGMVIATLTDKQEATKAVADMFHEEHDPGLIKDNELKAKYLRALEYYDRLQEVASQMKSQQLRERTGESVRQMGEWVANIYRLALRLQAFRADGILNRDRQQVPQALRDLQVRQRQETNPALREQFDATVTVKRQQYENIRTLDALMQKADLQLDNSIAALGTAYSQLLLIGTSREIDNTAARSLQESVRDEVASLQDLVTSINEVYDYRTEGIG